MNTANAPITDPSISVSPSGVVRGHGGRFLKGTKSASPGRPKGNRAEAFRRAMQNALGTKRFMRMVKELYVQAISAAEAKDRREACKYLIDQVIGRPGQAIQVTGTVATTNSPEEKRTAIMDRFRELQHRN